MPIPNTAAASDSKQAEPDSVDFDIVTAGHAMTGVISGCACTPNASGSTLVVAVAAGTVVIGGVAVTVTAGTATPGAASGTNPRFDLVTVDLVGAIAIVAGTAAATPVFPAVPSNRVALCAVLIPTSATSITAGNIVDKRQTIVMPGAVVPTASGIGNPYAGGPELRRWRAAWANRTTNPVNVLLLGDSNTVGYWATIDARRWSRIMADKLCIYNDQRAHVGWQPHHSITNYSLVWTDTGTITDNSLSGLGYGAVNIPGTGTSGSITAAQVCDRFWVHYSNGTGIGAFSVTIDGGTPVTVTPATGARVGGQVWDSGPLPRALHTVKIATTTTTATVFEGIQWWDGNANQAGAQGTLTQANALVGQGVRVWNAAKFGSAAGDFAAAAGGGTWWTDNLGIISPDVVFMAWGTNELAAATSPATFRTNLVTIIDRIITVLTAATRPTPSFVLVVPHASGASATAIDPYQTAIYLAAQDRGCAVIDRKVFMGYVDSDAVDPNGYGSSQDGATGRKHLSDTGHRAAGENAADFLMEVTGPKHMPRITSDAELRALRSQWAKRAASSVNLVVLGDSITQGYYASTFDQSLMGILMSRLCQANGQPVPAGYVPMGSNSLSSYVNRQWTMTNVTDSVNYGLGYSAGTLAASGSGVATITATCDRFWIMYPQAASGLGAFSITIDGVAAATVTPTGTARGGRVWDSGPLTRDSHTIRVTTTTATAAVVEGIYLFDGNGNTSGAQGTLTAANARTGAGVRLWNAAHFAYMASNYAASNNGTNWWTDGLDMIWPDAFVFVLGANDCTGTFTGFFHNDLVNIITRIKNLAILNGQIHPSIIIVSPYGVGASSVDAMPPFREMARQVAVEQGCAFVDLYEVMGYVGTAAADTYGLMSALDSATNKLHPSDTGHQLIGDYLSGWILSALGPTGQIPRPAVRKITAAGRSVTDAVTTNASATMTSATAAFVNSAYPTGDIGRSVIGFGIPRGTTITAVGSGTSVTLSANATATTSANNVSLVAPVTAINPTTEELIVVNTTTLPQELSMPTAVGAAGQSVTVKKVDSSANPVIIYTSSASTLEDGKEIEIVVDGVALTFMSDNTNWWLV